MQEPHVVAAHELEATAKIGLHPAINVFQAVRQRTSAVPQALIDRDHIIVAKSLDDHKQHDHPFVRRAILELVLIRNLEPLLDDAVPRKRSFEDEGIGSAPDRSRSYFLRGAEDARHKVFAVLDEARAFGDTVVEAYRRCIRFMGQPVDPRAARTRSLCIDVFDQFATDA